MGRSNGRFWAISPESDCESDGESSESDSSSIASGSTSWEHCLTPESARSIALKEKSSDLSRREAKRRRKRFQMQTRMQVRSEIDLNSLICSKSTSGSGASPARASVKPREAVLSPSSFLLENFNAEEWVLVRRRRRRASISAASSTSKVIYRATHWIRLWSYLLPVDQRELLDTGCNRLEMVTRDIFSRGGWRSTGRILTT